MPAATDRINCPGGAGARRAAGHLRHLLWLDGENERIGDGPDFVVVAMNADTGMERHDLSSWAVSGSAT